MKNRLFLLSILLLLTLSALSQQPLSNGLIAYYPYNGNANDMSGGQSNGTVNGASLTTDRFGNPNSAYSFDGISNYISYAVGTGFQPTTFPVSFTAWIKSNCSNTSYGVIFKNDENSSAYVGFSFVVGAPVGGILLASIGDGGGVSSGNRRQINGTMNVNDNQWHFVAAVLNGPNDMQLYVDCGYDENAYLDGSSDTIRYASGQGGTGISLGNPNNYYTGKIDDLRFYHRALTLNDLQNIYSYPKSFDGLSLHLPADTAVCENTQLTLIPTTTGNIQSYSWSNGSTDTSIQPTQAGSYSLQVYNGCSYAYDTTNVTFQNCAGVEQVNANPFSMYYSPENNAVQIQNLAAGQDDFSIDLYNTLGQKALPTLFVKGGYRSAYNYKLSERLASGIYFVNARMGNQNKSISVVK